MDSAVWNATSGGPVFAQPIVANGTVYWGSFDGYERATSTSGNLVWKTFLGTTTPPAGTCIPPTAGIASTPTYRLGWLDPNGNWEDGVPIPVDASQPVLDTSPQLQPTSIEGR